MAFFLILAFIALRLPTDNSTKQTPSERESEYAFEVGNLIFDASSDLARGRGLTLLALSGDRDTLRLLEPKIAWHRAAADAALFEALRLARTNLPFPPRNSPVEGVFTSFRDLQVLRDRADSHLEAMPDKKDAALIEEWFAVSSRVQDTLESLLVEAEQKARDPQVPIFPEWGIQHWAWIMSENAARERGLLAGILARHSSLISSEKARLEHYRDRLELAWEFVELKTDQLRIEGSTVAQLEEIEREFFGEYEAKRQLVYSALIGGETPPFSAVEWFEISSQAIETLLELGRTAAAESRNFKGQAL